MKINCVGGGPAGLYLGILMRQARPDVEIHIYERNKSNDTFGWGVVFSDETLGNFMEADDVTHQRITEEFVHWTNIDTHFKGQRIRSGGHGFSGISRRRLLQILEARAGELGCHLHFETEIEDADIERLKGDCDLLVAADGINSRTRTLYAEHFKPVLSPGRAKFIWLGTTKRFDAFKFFLKVNEHGMFQVHAYPFDAETSTFIVEMHEDVWKSAGLDQMSIDDGVEYCRELFAEHLDGHPLLQNKSDWINFREVKNDRWFHENVVLLGDAAHTAHFSIGSGTKLAMEDVIALVDQLKGTDDVPAALQAYEDARWVECAKLQKTAMTSQVWFEDIGRYADDHPIQLAFNMMCRSKRVTHENLRLRDEAYAASVDRWFADSCGLQDVDPPPPPMFTPFKLRDLTLKNRVVVSPMCMYSAEDGTVNDWHMVHIGSRAIGGAGLVICEMTDVSADARISPGCAGMYRDEHVAAWKRIVDFVHDNSTAALGLQLGHAGRKGATKRLWEGDNEPLEQGGWPLIAPSPIPYSENSQVPREMTREDMDRVRDDFVAAAKRADQAGFDLLEIHMAHGYLLATFLSPVTNKRTDEYGGSLENRLRYPLEIFDAVRAVWPGQKPMSVRISAVDWIPGGNEADDAVEIARAFQSHGLDLIDVSSGQTSPEQDPVYGRMYQVPFADRIRHELGIATMSVGAIQGYDQVNTVVASGRADLCAMARPHLRDPYLTLKAAEAQEYFDVDYPPQYRSARPRPRDPDADKRRR